MFNNIFKFFSILLILYQTPLYSKNTSLNNFKPKDLSNYFSGIVAYENKDNSKALKFFNSSKILLNKHDFFLKRYIAALVLEKKVPQAINVVKSNKGNKNTNFFDAYLIFRNTTEEHYEKRPILFDFLRQQFLPLQNLKQFRDEDYITHADCADAFLAVF